MPAKNKQPNKNKQIHPKPIIDDEDSQQEADPQIIVIKDDSKLQISSAQAELYFEYLRKKISHQTNDPFSLPFLNLKFEQLESWKVSTEQLNIQSRIYGMRVDNCHDYTVKLLNYVIRNQQQQIGKGIEIDQSQAKNEEFNTNKQSTKNDFNFHLEKAEKIACEVQMDKNLHNRSLWKMIFKKSETLNEIQLNKLQLSNDLRLEIDQKNAKWYKKQQLDQQNIHNEGNYEDIDDILAMYLTYVPKLQIFQQITAVKLEVNQEVQQIIERNKMRQRSRNQQTIEQPLYNEQFGYKDLNFDDLYQQFNDFSKYQEDAKIVKSSQDFNDSFQEQSRQDILLPGTRELFQIPIEHLYLMNSQMQMSLKQDYEQDSQNEDLYEPQKDILFHSTIKKTKFSKKIDNRKFGKRRKEYNTVIDFYNPSLVTNRTKVFNHAKPIKNNIKNDNLVPISYIIVYESRNPFRKFKKTRNQNRVSLYEQHNNNDTYFQNNFEQGTYHQSLHQVHISQTIQQEFSSIPLMYPFHSQLQMNSTDNIGSEKKYLSVSMKTVKNEIKKEILSNEGNSMLNSRQLSRTSNHSESLYFDEGSLMQTNLEEEAKMIGLKLLRQKMKNFDPLDILVSMLHVAYEEQVLLHAVYQQDIDSMRLRDIVIQDFRLSP